MFSFISFLHLIDDSSIPERWFRRLVHFHFDQNDLTEIFNLCLFDLLTEGKLCDHQLHLICVCVCVCGVGLVERECHWFQRVDRKSFSRLL